MRARPRARGPVHGRPRAVPDRHRGLRRHRAARDHHPRALRHPQGLRPPLPEPEPARHRARSARASRTPRSSACWPRAWASTIPACARATSRWRARPSTGTTRTWRASTSSGWSARASVRLSVPDPYAPFARGRLPDAVGQVRAAAPTRWRRRASTRSPTYMPPREGADQSNPELAAALPARLHLAARAPLPELDLLRAARRSCGARASPSLTIHPRGRGRARHRATAQMVRTFNDRGSFLATARVSDARAPGRGGRPVDLVGQDVPGRPQRQRRHRPGADRHGRRAPPSTTCWSRSSPRVLSRPAWSASSSPPPS